MDCGFSCLAKGPVLLRFMCGFLLLLADTRFPGCSSGGVGEALGFCAGGFGETLGKPLASKASGPCGTASGVTGETRASVRISFNKDGSSLPDESTLEKIVC